MTLLEQRDAIRSRAVSAREVAAWSLGRAERLGARFNILREVHADAAIKQAEQIDARLGAGESVGPLAGVPIVLKDNICCTEGHTTCGSRILEGYRSPFDATVVERLRGAGAVILGKANCDEFAMGSSTESSAFGPTRNPWDPSRVPGGSSGGSAAAVAARIVHGALGSDTGGSIRQPAAFCGLVGVKPTYGRVSRWGLVAYASSLDQIGPLTRSTADSALLMQTICGFDPLDSTSSDAEVPDFLANLDAMEPAGLRIGVPREARSSSNHPAVTAILDSIITRLRDAGAQVVEIELPHLPYAIAAYYLIATAEASSNLARFDGVRYGRRATPEPGEDLLAMYSRSRAEGLGAEVQKRIMLGTHALSSGYYDAYYLTALKVRRLIRRDFDHVFGLSTPGAPAMSGPSPACHAILMPTTPGPAFELGSKTSDPLAMYLEDAYTVPVNLAGIPAASVPGGMCQIGEHSLPIGLQVLCPAFEDERLLRVCRLIERISPPDDDWPVADYLSDDA